MKWFLVLLYYLLSELSFSQLNLNIMAPFTLQRKIIQNLPLQSGFHPLKSTFYQKTYGGARLQRSGASRSELGPLIGGSYYTGELNRMGHFKQLNLALGLIYKYNINPRLTYRLSATYGGLKGDDSKQKSDFAKNRNLSFKSVLIEVATGVEFNYYQYQMNSRKHAITTYMFVEIAGFYMNPQANYNGQWIDLQPLGTEGQGNNGKKKYSRFQIAVPFGLGVKFNLWPGACMAFEYGLRLTFTDYIDDVSGNYFDNDKLRSLNGPTAATLADRSLKPLGLNGSNTGYKRGNPHDKDWYGVFGMTITFQLGKANTCWMF
jgi:hypothetical protein